MAQLRKSVLILFQRMGKDKESYEKNLQKFEELTRDLDEERRSKKKKKKKDRKRSPSPEKVRQNYFYLSTCNFVFLQVNASVN